MLERFLINVPSWEQDEYFKLKCEGNRLSIGSCSMDVEAKDNWEHEFMFKHLKHLKKLLKKVPEQPLVIDVRSGEMQIKEICC